MNSLRMTSADEITMRLVHYFVTKENYQPIVVNGLENEIWLENTEKRYEVIRINSNYIHNDEQLNFDMFKAKAVIKQIKRKMFSLNCNTLNIMLNVSDNVTSLDSGYKHMDIVKVDATKTLDKEENITSLFPDIVNDKIDSLDDMDFFINVTQDINKSTEKKNRLYEKTFKKKTIVVTYALIVINTLIFMLELLGLVNINYFATSPTAIRAGHYWVILTSAFLHADIIHLVCNMWSLYIIGTQLETVLGKVKFLVVYFVSAIVASLLSGVLTGGAAIGASGAIFGLIGALLYFGYHYRLYLGNVIIRQLVPVVILNLLIGFSLSNVDNFGHIGGLLGGVFSAMMVGVEGKSEKSDIINGVIISLTLIVFLLYMILR
ncbi:MAG: rhomboid family intramembrane serine protease [Erysipelotrichales bacterium]|nr:rhomboid family intramembrane serine protease [Erysipelotrichales bacterium]